MEARRKRQNNKKSIKDGKIRKLSKDPGLPKFGQEKRQLERKNRLLKEKLQGIVNGEGSNQNKNGLSLESLVQNAQNQQKKYSLEMASQKEEFQSQHVKEDNAAIQTRRAFFHQLKEVINRSDVIIIVLDARDPMGCRSKLIERKVLEKDPNKRIILILNKIDLVPKAVAMTWLNLLRQEYPTILFKASTQSQKAHLGRNDMDIRKANSNLLSSNVCLGAENLLQLLKNYCRNNGVKTSITVGIIGYPNVGKSSLINSLKRSRAVGVSSTAGFTRVIQEIQIDRNISLLDCPGIIFNNNNSSYLLRNCVDVHEIDDPEGIVERMLTSLASNSSYLENYYAIPPFSNVREFLAYVARSRGKLKKGGIPDMRSAACVVINDFNQGMIPFYVKPPRKMIEQSNAGLQIVNNFSDSFDINHVSNDNINVVKDLNSTFDDDKYMVLEAAEDEEDMDNFEDVDIPILDRHLGKRDTDVQVRIASKEEILQQRQEMLNEEMMKQKEEDDDMEEEDSMNDNDAYDYSTAFVQ